MCRVLGVSKSGYYKWSADPMGKRGRADQELGTHIRNVFNTSRKTYGIRRVYHSLRQMEIRCGKMRVARVMQELGLSVRYRRKFRQTTDSKHSYDVHPNLLERNFRADAPDRAWVADITYIPTDEGWLYLGAVLDLCGHKVVGWSMSESLGAEIALDALKMALGQRKPDAGLVHHSDRGVQYACRQYQALLQENSIICSMSRKGNCWDNAVAESFFSRMKTELMDGRCYASRRQARMEIFDYIEVFYNRQRLHSSLGYMSPEQYEAKLIAA